MVFRTSSSPAASASAVLSSSSSSAIAPKGMEGAHGGQLGLASVHSGSHGGKQDSMEVDHHREERQKLMIRVGGNMTSSLSSWLQRVGDLRVELGSGSGVGVLEWLGCLC
ncbi:hypothetical protein CMV_004059 [Castanea mollissima]|uniref:Uncharacterized protein n=1 Tax=Castanea mollissima TaxID=60419 RepID=A0A8J4W2J9_9ROSI|nr:hypothetical protein CMV_004059 [Castanea mollissima]